MSCVKKSICALLACFTMLPLVFIGPGVTKVSAASDANVNINAERQVIRGFGGMNHPAWIGDLTAPQRETAFGNGQNQLGFSILRIYVDENRNNWHREVATAKRAIEHGALVIASPWNPPSSMVETSIVMEQLLSGLNTINTQHMLSI
ncbi:Glucuronoxylanase XynC precursor [Bacillus pumilus]|nr:Glucuronoxylanase XynC precursor [Bacillus pumilus]